jgi:hypothetical protein
MGSRFDRVALSPHSPDYEARILTCAALRFTGYVARPRQECEAT